uniref:rRNA N-glycosylase n=1 Tax=Oryza brachyantha TaxID=4533 RepID=J3M6L3_ORYBR
MANPAFTVELDVSRGSSYGGFISGVRDKLVRHAAATRHLELVLLPVQEEYPRDAPLVPTSKSCSGGDPVAVLLQIRADNLYIRGYRSGEAGRRCRGGGQLSFGDS